MSLFKRARLIKTVVAALLMAVLFFSYYLLKENVSFPKTDQTATMQAPGEQTINVEENSSYQETEHIEQKNDTTDGSQSGIMVLYEENVEKILLDVPLINQMENPRLYNGCEVTSLAMILNFKGIPVTKNELANTIKKVPLQYENGLRGNPNEGFVGNMEDGPGLGVYHGRIFDLATKYAEGRVENLTGEPFEILLKEVAAENPVWVISTSNFVPVSNFVTWNTPQGQVEITFSMHSGVITGFDKDYIYVNNPYGYKNQKIARDQFIAAWEQMGSQAIVIH